MLRIVCCLRQQLIRFNQACVKGMVDFTGSGLRIADCGLRIADCEPMQIVYFFGKKPQELPVATCSYAMPPRKWLYMSWL